MDPPGRFLKEDRGTGLWFDIGDAKAIKKTGQALREDAPDIRPNIEGEGPPADDNIGLFRDANESSRMKKRRLKKSLDGVRCEPPTLVRNVPPPG